MLANVLDSNAFFIMNNFYFYRLAERRSKTTRTFKHIKAEKFPFIGSGGENLCENNMIMLVENNGKSMKFH